MWTFGRQIQFQSESHENSLLIFMWVHSNFIYLLLLLKHYGNIKCVPFEQYQVSMTNTHTHVVLQAKPDHKWKSIFGLQFNICAVHYYLMYIFACTFACIQKKRNSVHLANKISTDCLLKFDNNQMKFSIYNWSTKHTLWPHSIANNVYWIK